MRRVLSNSKLRSTRSGAALVETALMLPVLLMVTFGVIEFGRALMVSNLICNAAREGTRLGIIQGVTTTEVKNTVVTQVNSTVGTDITAGNVTVTITPYGTNPNPSNECANASSRDLVAVNVSVPYSKVGYFFRYLANVNLRGQAAMRHE